MEPNVCICQFDASGKLTVWISTQAPFMVRGSLSDVLGIPMSQIRVICEHMGGGFGAKQDLYQHEYLCVLLAQRTGRPVKMEYTRAETFIAGRTRHPVIVELKQGVKRDGTLTARQARYIANSGAYGSHGPGVTRVGTSALGSLHKCPNVQIEGLCVYTNTPIAGAFRGYGAPQAYFALESQMDAIAERLGIDPIELRLRNAFQVGDRGPSGTPFTSCELPDCLHRGAALIDWNGLRERSGDVGPIKRGVGVACQLHSATSYPAVKEAAGAIISINEDGTAQLLVGSADLGTGSKTVLAQIAAEELGIPFEHIRVVSGDTDVTPYDIGAYASRTTFISGGATQAAAAQAKEQLLALAAQDLQTSVADLEIRDGVIRSKGAPLGAPEKALTLKKLLASPGGRAGRAPSSARRPLRRATTTPLRRNSPKSPWIPRPAKLGSRRWSPSTTSAEPSTRPRLRARSRARCSKGSASPCWKTWWSTTRPAATRNVNFVDYKLLTALDMPEIQVELLESEDELGPFGAKGVAEDGTCPTAAAIANAIYHAIGVRMKELPITAERLLAALHPASPADPSP